jgi:hypothetical protein
VVALLRLLWLVLRKNPGGLYSLLARAAAEGALGKHAQSFYLWSIGKKTVAGIILGCAYFIASILCTYGIHIGCQLVSWIGDTSVFLLSWGVVDSAARATPPVLTTARLTPEVHPSRP